MKILTQQDIVESWVSPVVRVETIREILCELQSDLRKEYQKNTIISRNKPLIAYLFVQKQLEERFGLLFKDEKCGAR